VVLAPRIRSLLSKEGREQWTSNADFLDGQSLPILIPAKLVMDKQFVRGREGIDPRLGDLCHLWYVTCDAVSESVSPFGTALINAGCR
jgi:hypothetical protein